MLFLYSFGVKKMSPISDPENVSFFIRWWQQILSGIILILFGWYAKAKGNKEESSTIIPLSEDHIDNKMQI